VSRKILKVKVIIRDDIMAGELDRFNAWIALQIEISSFFKPASLITRYKMKGGYT